MGVSPGRNEILEVYHQPRVDQDQPCQDKSNMGQEDPERKVGYRKLFKILQLQYTIHQRFQQHSKTSVWRQNISKVE